VAVFPGISAVSPVGNPMVFPSRFFKLQITHQPNVEAKWVEPTKLDTWRRESYIKESGFATPPGSSRISQSLMRVQTRSAK
jgi:hypothetical protein